MIIWKTSLWMSSPRLLSHLCSLVPVLLDPRSLLELLPRWEPSSGLHLGPSISAIAGMWALSAACSHSASLRPKELDGCFGFVGWHLLSPTTCYVKVISLSSHPNCTLPGIATGLPRWKRWGMRSVTTLTNSPSLQEVKLKYELGILPTEALLLSILLHFCEGKTLEKGEIVPPCSHSRKRVLERWV